MLIDSSGSMKQPVKWGKREKPGAGAKGGTSAGKRDDAKGKEGEGFATTRLEACKMELIKALERLDRSKTFNIVWYSDLPHLWSEKMQKAVPPRIRKAQAWIRKLKPMSSTNIHDSMQMAFGFAKGGGSKGKAFGTEVGVDTIFLLSDGAPTDGSFDSAKLMDPEIILEAVRQWNKDINLKIHTVAVDITDNYFLRTLATEHGGQWVERKTG